MPRISIAVLTVLLAVPAFSQEAPKKRHPIEEALQQCMDKAQSTADMIACEDEAYKKWDEELNRVYKLLQAKLTPKQKDALKAAQLAWIKQRDHELAWIGALYDGFEGTMYQPMRVEAAKSVIQLRAEELAHYLELVEEHATPQDAPAPDAKAPDGGK